jgi:hypothetical protein
MDPSRYTKTLAPVRTGTTWVFHSLKFVRERRTVMRPLNVAAAGMVAVGAETREPAELETIAPEVVSASPLDVMADEMWRRDERRDGNGSDTKSRFMFCRTLTVGLHLYLY